MMKDECLGSETYDDLGFKSDEELNREIQKLIQVREEFTTNSELISSK